MCMIASVKPRPGRSRRKLSIPNGAFWKSLAGEPLDGNVVIEKAAERSREDVNGYGK